MKMLEGSTLLNPRVEFTDREMEWIVHIIAMAPNDVTNADSTFYKYLSRNLERFLSVDFAPIDEKEFMLENKDALLKSVAHYKVKVQEHEKFGEDSVLLQEYRNRLKEQEEWLKLLN